GSRAVHSISFAYSAEPFAAHSESGVIGAVMRSAPSGHPLACEASSSPPERRPDLLEGGVVGDDIKSARRNSVHRRVHAIDQLERDLVGLQPDRQIDPALARDEHGPTTKYPVVDIP